MKKYLCEKCGFNNNGWCNKQLMNGLKKKNIQDCQFYKLDDKSVDDTMVKLLKTVEAKTDKLYEQYFSDEDVTPNDLLDDAIKIMNLQKGIIDNLMFKINKVVGVKE